MLISGIGCSGVSGRSGSTGELPPQLNKRMLLHIKQMDGTNNHHLIEAAYKAFAKALDEATMAEPRLTGTLSTKGTL